MRAQRLGRWLAGLNWWAVAAVILMAVALTLGVLGVSPVLAILLGMTSLGLILLSRA